ncbi:hypothetical protein M0Q50_04335 [bacterium]|nr:hypothetical protein [bacterium]
MKIILDSIIIYIFISIVCYRYLINKHNYFLIMFKLSDEKQKNVLEKYIEFDKYKKMILYISLLPLVNIFFVFLIRRTIILIDEYNDIINK